VIERGYALGQCAATARFHRLEPSCAIAADQVGSVGSGRTCSRRRAQDSRRDERAPRDAMDGRARRTMMNSGRDNQRFGQFHGRKSRSAFFWQMNSGEPYIKMELATTRRRQRSPVMKASAVRTMPDARQGLAAVAAASAVMHHALRSAAAVLARRSARSRHAGAMPRTESRPKRLRARSAALERDLTVVGGVRHTQHRKESAGSCPFSAARRRLRFPESQSAASNKRRRPLRHPSHR